MKATWREKITVKRMHIVHEHSRLVVSIFVNMTPLYLACGLSSTACWCRLQKSFISSRSCQWDKVHPICIFRSAACLAAAHWYWDAASNDTWQHHTVPWLIDVQCTLRNLVSPFGFTQIMAVVNVCYLVVSTTINFQTFHDFWQFFRECPTFKANEGVL